MTFTDSPPVEKGVYRVINVDLLIPDNTEFDLYTLQYSAQPPIQGITLTAGMTFLIINFEDVTAETSGLFYCKLEGGAWVRHPLQDTSEKVNARPYFKIMRGSYKGQVYRLKDDKYYELDTDILEFDKVADSIASITPRFNGYDNTAPTPITI